MSEEAKRLDLDSSFSFISVSDDNFFFFNFMATLYNKVKFVNALGINKLTMNYTFTSFIIG